MNACCTLRTVPCVSRAIMRAVRVCVRCCEDTVTVIPQKRKIRYGCGMHGARWLVRSLPLVRCRGVQLQGYRSRLGEIDGSLIHVSCDSLTAYAIRVQYITIA